MERNRAGAQQEGETYKFSVDIAEDAQGGRGNGQAWNIAAELVRILVAVTAESRADVSSNGFWKWGTTAMFVIGISNLNKDLYLRTMPGNDLAKSNKDKKDLYLQD